MVPFPFRSQTRPFALICFALGVASVSSRGHNTVGVANRASLGHHSNINARSAWKMCLVLLQRTTAPQRTTITNTCG